MAYFSGIQKSKRKASEIKLSAPCLNDKSIQWIKRLRVQQAFSASAGLCEESCEAPRGSQNPKFEAASRIMKERFPQHTDRGSNPTAEQSIETFGSSSIARSAYTTPLVKQSVAQLTIFYNGMVGVYDVSEKQAEDIIRLAGNEISSHQLHSAGFNLRILGKPITISSTNTSNQTEERLLLKPLENNAPQQLLIQKLRTNLPLQRNQSLQRFLQNRKEYRTKRVAPYSQSQAAKY